MSSLLMCPDLILSAHDIVILLSWEVCSCEYLWGDIHTSIILEDWEGGSCWIGIMPSWESIVSLGKWSSSRHLPVVSQINSSRYHLVFGALSCPPVALDAPFKRSRLS